MKELPPREAGDLVVKMTLKLELSKDLERQLAAEAGRLGLAVEQYALELLRSAAASQRPTTGADLVAYWRREGLIGSSPEIPDSQAHARDLRERAQRRPLS